MSTKIGSVTINRNPSFLSAWWHERMNQGKVNTADGGRVVYDNGPSILRGLLNLRNVDATEAGSLRTYLKDTAIFQKNTFDIVPPTNTDLGAGAGATVSGVRLDELTSLESVFRFNPPGIYDVNIPYEKAI